MPKPPQFSADTNGPATRFALAGSWTIDASSRLERSGLELVSAALTGKPAIFDLGGIERLDTACAWAFFRFNSRRARFVGESAVARSSTDTFSCGIDEDVFDICRGSLDIVWMPELLLCYWLSKRREDFDFVDWRLQLPRRANGLRCRRLLHRTGSQFFL